MNNISQVHLKTLSVLVLPIDEQRRFTKVVAFARTVSKLATHMSRLLGAGV